jgi:hypothetical protein
MFIMICDDAPRHDETQTLAAQVLLALQLYEADLMAHGYRPLREMTTEEIIDAARRGS